MTRISWGPGSLRLGTLIGEVSLTGGWDRPLQTAWADIAVRNLFEDGADEPIDDGYHASTLTRGTEFGNGFEVRAQLLRTLQSEKKVTEYPTRVFVAFLLSPLSPLERFWTVVTQHANQGCRCHQSTATPVCGSCGRWNLVETKLANEL